MNIKRNPLKILTALFAVIIATIFGSSPFKVLSVETKTYSKETLQERLAKVREKLQQQEEYKTGENSHLPFSPDQTEAEADETLLSQWYNWGNWPNWNDWNNWGNWPNYWGNY